MLHKKYDDRKHPAMLQELWIMAFPDLDPPSRVNEQWMLLGFTGADPCDDFSGDGTGMYVLDLLLYFAEEHNAKFKGVLERSNGGDEKAAYPMASAAVRVCDMLLRSVRLLGEEGAGLLPARIHMNTHTHAPRG